MGLGSALRASAYIYAFESSTIELESDLHRTMAIEWELLAHRHNLEAYLITYSDLAELR